MTSSPSQDAALCLRIDLASPCALASVEGIELRHLDQLLRLAAQMGVRLQFCVSAGWIAEHAGQLTQILAAGHAVDGCLSASTDTSLHDVDSIRRQLEEMESAFWRAKANWWGLGVPGNRDTIGAHEIELFELLMDRGYRWVSSRCDPQAGIPGCQPAMLAPDLVGIPALEPAGSEASLSRVAHDAPEIRPGPVTAAHHLARRMTALLEEAAASSLALVVALPIRELSLHDPDGQVVQETITRAQTLDLPLVTLNEIADVALARSQAAPEAQERISMRQNLLYQDLWDRTIGPTQQPYKVYDYRGGWRLKPGFYRATACEWEALSQPDREHGHNINRHGFRGDMFPHRKARQERRIVVVGNSCVFGTAGDATPWPAQMQIRLDEIAGDGAFHVINAGIEGHSSVHCLMRLERLLTFEPDFVLIAVAANDLFIEDPADYVDTAGAQYATSWEVVGEYPRERDVTRSVGGVRRPMTIDDFYPFSYDYHLREMVHRCRRAEVVPLLMSLPCLLPSDMTLVTDVHLGLMHHPPFVVGGDALTMRKLYESYAGAVRRVAEEEQVAFIDAEGLVASRHDDQRQVLFSDTCHPTPEGNRLIGRHVAERVWQLITDDKEHSEAGV